jgi:hypothetical protein
MFGIRPNPDTQNTLLFILKEDEVLNLLESLTCRCWSVYDTLFYIFGLINGIIFSVIIIAAVIFSVSQEDLLKVVHTRNSYTGIPRSRYVVFFRL